MSITYPLVLPALPLYTGAVTAVDPVPNTASLAGKEYPIDLEKYSHRGLPAFREGVVQTNQPSDHLFDSQGAWWRYRFSFHHGAGQRVADLDDEQDPAVFYESRGINPWEKYQACLLNATEEVRTSAIEGIILCATATHVYARTAAQQVYRSADLITWNLITGMAAEDIVDMTTDGTSCYIATTGHIYEVESTTSATSITTGTPTTSFNQIAFVANRLLAGDGELLVEVGSSSLDTIYNHYQDAFRWTAIFNVGSRIYVGGYAGNRSELFSTIILEDGSIATSNEATSFFAGEQILDAMSYGGSVLLATSKGVRFATLGTDSTLTYGPVIDAPGISRCLAAEGRFAWFGWESFPDAGAGVGRLAFDEFVGPLQPAYATDEFTEDTSTDDKIVDVVRFGGRTVFAVAGEGVYATDLDTYVDSGYIDSGEIYFGTVENKSVGEVRAQTSTLASGESVAVSVTDVESGTVLASGSSSTLGSVGVAVNAEGEQSNRVRVIVTLGGPGTSTPCLRQWRARAYPIGPPVEEWIVPFIIDDSVILGDGQGHVRSIDVWDEVEALKAYWETREVVIYQEGNHAHRVRIDNFEFKPKDWRDDGDWLNGTLTVRLLSV